ncbi:MAG: murein transglycosylase A [Alphaproteobacteria bacterium]
MPAPARLLLRFGHMLGVALAGAVLCGQVFAASVTSEHKPSGRVGGMATAFTKAIAFTKLAGWGEDAQSLALAAFRRSCPRIGHGASTTVPGLAVVCAAAQKLPTAPSDAQARRFFETHFEPVAVAAGARHKGLFTGYFEPELNAALQPTRHFRVALLAPPKNLVSLAKFSDRQGLPDTLTHALKVNGRLKMAPTREQIEAGALGHAARPVAWLASAVDAFFLHVQGSGRLRLPDGRQVRVTYAGKNGHPYTSIGKVLVEHGEIDKSQISMQSIRAWMAKNPEKAGSLMAKNRSYIFFNLVANDRPELGPTGQMGVALTPGRSLAVDLAYHAPGLPIWLETTVPGVPGVPGENGGPDQAFAQLLVAQDTGSAIKGPLRGDIFFGTGAQAGQRAGRMQAPGAMYVLRPRPEFERGAQ